MKNAPTKVCSPSLHQKMLLQCPLDGDKLQALLEEEHPESSIFGYMVCPVCGGHLHGHGWRSRFAQDSEDTSFRVWIHRKCCRHCHLTFSLLPKILHVLKIYTLKTIIGVLSFRLERGHFSRALKVPVKLQRIWFMQFRRRMRLETDFPCLKAALQDKDSQILSSPVGLTEIKECAEVSGWFLGRSASHHRLAFYTPP